MALIINYNNKYIYEINLFIGTSFIIFNKNIINTNHNIY